MKRVFLYGAMLMLTFVVGVYVNALVLRAAYYFIPDVDRQPRVEAAPQPEVLIELYKDIRLVVRSEKP